MNVNLEMVKNGLAEVYRGRPAKGFDNGPYLKAEASARETKINMWSLGDKYISSKEWRTKNK
jgi:micrococcal nuclease